MASKRFWCAGAPESQGQRTLSDALPTGIRGDRQAAFAASLPGHQHTGWPLNESGVLQPGTFSLSSVYRLLVREGLDRPRLIAEGSGPTKAFETELANALWMADVMDGPTLRVGGRVVHTFLFALLDDCSRLVPHGQYYDNEKLGPLLDCLKEAFKRRGLPEKLYTDQGKILSF